MERKSQVWKPGMWARNAVGVYEVLEVYEGDWLGEPYFELLIRDGNETRIVIAHGCSPAEKPDAS
jgi:hypothetical protein